MCDIQANIAISFIVIVNVINTNEHHSNRVMTHKESAHVRVTDTICISLLYCTASEWYRLPGFYFESHTHLWLMTY